MAAETVGRHKAGVREDVGKTNEEKVMVKEQFTQAPWRIVEGSSEISILGEGKKESDYYHLVCAIDKSLDKFRANANLIGRAPIMYEFLGYIQDYLQKLVFDDIDKQFINEIWIDAIRMEMRNARGGE